MKARTMKTLDSLRRTFLSAMAKLETATGDDAERMRRLADDCKSEAGRRFNVVLFVGSAPVCDTCGGPTNGRGRCISGWSNCFGKYRGEA